MPSRLLSGELRLIKYLPSFWSLFLAFSPHLFGQDTLAPESSSKCLSQNAEVSSLVISSSVRLCGEWNIENLQPGSHIFSINSPDITISCSKDFLLTARNSMGSVTKPTVAFFVSDTENITIKNCRVHGLRYAVHALNSQNIQLRNNDFSSNYHDPSAGWVQDKFQGGGIRLERVEEGRIFGNNLSENWNGIELRHSNKIFIRKNIASHCSNTGITLVNSHYNVIGNNDFSFAVRGPKELDISDRQKLLAFLQEDAKKALSLKAAWYAIDTKDSAGIIVDYGSSHNKILNNDFSFGGDGIFVRSVIGACAEYNRFEGNETSYSPHNAIESWCDHNTFIDNNASYSGYGVWLGGSDNTIVKNNIINNNIVDGISIQIAEGRHNQIEGNEIKNNGRVGVLLTGREYQAWHSLTRKGPKLANSSDILVQNNLFANNGRYDAFVSATRGAYFVNNFSDHGSINLKTDFEAEYIFVTDPTIDPNMATSSTAYANEKKIEESNLASAKTANIGVTLKSSRTSISVGESIYLSADPQEETVKKITWTIQAAGDDFGELAEMPKAILHQEFDEITSLKYKFLSTGLFDVNVFVLTESGAKTFHRDVYVKGDTPLIVKDIETHCPSSEFECSVKISNSTKRSALPEIDLSINTPFSLEIIFGIEPQMISSMNTLEFFVRAHNVNGIWQTEGPDIFLYFKNGEKVTAEPDFNWLPLLSGHPKHISVPLTIAEHWTLSAPIPHSDLIAIEIDTDTMGWEPYSVTFGGFSLLAPTANTGSVP